MTRIPVLDYGVVGLLYLLYLGGDFIARKVGSGAPGQVAQGRRDAA